MRDGLDGLNDFGVDSVLSVFSLVSDSLSLLRGLFEEVSSLGSSFNGDLLGEEFVVDGIEGGDGSEVDLGGGGDDIGLVDSLKRDSVEFVGAGDEEEAGGEGLQEDDSSASESAGEDDQDLSGLDVLSESGGFAGLALSHEVLLGIGDGVPVLRLLKVLVGAG